MFGQVAMNDSKKQENYTGWAYSKAALQYRGNLPARNHSIVRISIKPEKNNIQKALQVLQPILDKYQVKGKIMLFNDPKVEIEGY